MITGGIIGKYGSDRSTEVLRVGDVAWTYVGRLPAGGWVGGVNLGNRLLMTGTNNVDKIVE